MKTNNTLYKKAYRNVDKIFKKCQNTFACRGVKQYVKQHVLYKEQCKGIVSKHER